MNFLPIYQFYSASVVFSNMPPLIIITSWLAEPNCVMGEWFVCIPDQDVGTFFFQRTVFRLDESASSKDNNENLEVILTELLAQAKSRLRRYLLDSQQSRVEFLSDRSIVVLPCSCESIAQVWMYNSDVYAFQKVCYQTRCRPLTRFMELLFKYMPRMAGDKDIHTPYLKYNRPGWPPGHESLSSTNGHSKI